MAQKRNQKYVEQMTRQFENMWLVRIMTLAHSAVVWDGADQYGFDSGYLEICLQNRGSGMIVREQMINKYIAGGNISTGNLDVEGNPIEHRVSFRNGVTASYSHEDSVLIWNNPDRISDMWIWRMLAAEMANYDMAMRVNVNAIKTMPIIPSTQTRALSQENVMSAIANNMPYLLVDNAGLDITSMREALQFDNRKSCVLDLLKDSQDNLWNKILTLIGINSIPINKRERLVTSEADANLDEIMVVRNSRIQARKMAAKEMAKKWGMDVKPHYVSDGNGGDLFGNIYNAGADNRNEPVDNPETRRTAAETE